MEQFRSFLARLWRAFLKAMVWLYQHTVVYTFNTLRASQDARKGALLAMAWMLLPLLLWNTVPWGVRQVQFAFSDAQVESINPDAPAYVDIVRNARGQLQGFNRDILDHVVEEYNAYVESKRWQKGAERCMTFLAEFEEVERLTLYPKELIAGIALHESAGCRQGASDWAGGKGLMQITNIDKSRHVKPVAQMLNIRVDQVDYRTNTLHNLLVGVMVLDDYERRLGSRPHGLLAYNRGVGGVRKDARKSGWHPGDDLPSVTQMRPHLRHDGSMKPRVYVPRVLATTAMMDRQMRGKPLKATERMRPKDIPGWDPSDDGATWLSMLGLR